ncbi:MAG: type II toxin-antitoxin system VapC family toxin [Gammaproteobacteria bacterium]
MKVLVDTSVLIYLAYPNASAPLDPKTHKPVTHCAERIEGLIEQLDKSDTELVIPTPVLSELLIRAHNRQAEILAAVSQGKSVQLAPFDEMAAVENAALRRRGLSTAARSDTKKEVSFDLQILAIARVTGCEVVLTDDEDLRKRCETAGIKVWGIADLVLPDASRQIAMTLETPSEEPGRSIEQSEDEDEDEEEDED